jgi:hypothetical protein
MECTVTVMEDMIQEQEEEERLEYQYSGVFAMEMDG